MDYTQLPLYIHIFNPREIQIWDRLNQNKRKIWLEMWEDAGHIDYEDT